MPQNARIPIRVSADEKSDLKNLAKKTGLSVSEFIRRSALGKEIDPAIIIPEVNRATYSELSKIGTNLNQIAAKLNQDQMPDRDRIINSLAACVKLTKEVRGQLVSVGEQNDSQN